MIRLTKQADYGVVLMTYFVHEAEGATLSARDLAHKSKLPLPTVTKILKLLARAGLLASQRGVKGGYRLTREAAAIAVADVLAALGGPVALTQCSVSGEGCRRKAICPARPNWTRLDEAIRGAFASTTLADMAHHE